MDEQEIPSAGRSDFGDEPGEVYVYAIERSEKYLSCAGAVKREESFESTVRSLQLRRGKFMSRLAKSWADTRRGV